MTAENILKQYFEGIIQKIQADVNLINSLIGHTGEIGKENEKLLRDLLEKFIPKQFKIGSGIIIDKDGKRSNQIDLIIYDSQFQPELFAQSSTIIFPVDVVYMAIEIKTTFNKQIIENAIKNISSVKNLNFIKSKVMYVEHGKPEESTAASMKLVSTSPPLGVIFGFRSDTKNFDTFDSWINTDDLETEEIFDIIFSLDNTFFQHFDSTTHSNSIHKGFSSLNGKAEVIEKNDDGVYKQNGKEYPIVTVKEKNYAVEPERGLILFLTLVSEALSQKKIIQTSIVREYLGDLINASYIDEGSKE